jgi:hypothetical protein
MKSLFTISFIFLSNFLLANNPTTAFEQLSSVNSQWNYQTSLNKNLFTIKAKSLSEKELIKYHLQETEKLLRGKSVSHLTNAQQIQRAKNIDILHYYMLTSVFPINEKYEERTPCFIDKYDTYCAVGYLMKNTGGFTIANDIKATQNYSYLKNITHPKLMEWVENSGFTIDELALIQPGYTLDKSAYLLEIHYNNVGTDVNEYIEFMQASSNTDASTSNQYIVNSILFYNESNVLYKTLNLSQMQVFTKPTITYSGGLLYYYTPTIYHYTFPTNESFADAGRIEFKRTDAPYNLLCNEIIYNSNSIQVLNKWMFEPFVESNSKIYNVGESESTPLDKSLTFGGIYDYPNLNLNNWFAAIQPSSRGSYVMNSVLPVSELEDFSLQINKNSALLKWNLNGNLNGKFIIEKNTTENIFETIGFINSYNNVATYSFTDNLFYTKSNYRIKFEKPDGTYKYSNIIVAEKKEKNTISLLQNPVTNNLNVAINIEDNKNSFINIFDFLGRKIITKKAINGIQQIDISKLNRGYYIIQFVSFDGKVTNEQFLKSN